MRNETVFWSDTFDKLQSKANVCMWAADKHVIVALVGLVSQLRQGGNRFVKKKKKTITQKQTKNEEMNFHVWHSFLVVITSKQHLQHFKLWCFHDLQLLKLYFLWFNLERTLPESGIIFQWKLVLVELWTEQWQQLIYFTIKLCHPCCHTGEQTWAGDPPPTPAVFFLNAYGNIEHSGFSDVQKKYMFWVSLLKAF